MLKIIVTLFLAVSPLMASAKNDYVLVEAESFSDKGGWVLDQQFMDQMGSPYLLAHGLGVPVADARTEVRLPRGTWHVYARTFDWCSPWKVEGPGRFRIAVDGTDLENELGKGSAWGWELAGTVQAGKDPVVLSLRDLTGFEGRCDAVLFSRTGELPADRDLPAFRKKMLGLPQRPEKLQFDLVVAGGGIAGTAAAIRAARQGVRVALINDRPVPGGNNSTEIRVVASGALQAEPYPGLGEITAGLRNFYWHEESSIRMITDEPNISYFPNMHVVSARCDGEQIRSVVAKHVGNGTEIEFEAPLFADCTGDGSLGYMAGAEYMVGSEKRQDTRETLAPDRETNRVLGATTGWAYSVEAAPSGFPSCPWAIQFTDDSCERDSEGINMWEAGQLYDQVADAEYIRDYLFRAIYGNWAFLKNDSRWKGEYANRKLDRLDFLAGKRESRRLLGDVFFRQQDIEGDWRNYDDALIKGTYSIDQHFPTPKNSFYFEGEEFMTTMRHYFNPLGVPRRYLRDDQVSPPYYLPYRCLYSKNISNLFMAGRDVSVSHIALASTRVMNMTGMMGETVGQAASICLAHSCTPREVYTLYLQELLDAFRCTVAE